MKTIREEFPDLLQKNTSILQENTVVKSCKNPVQEVQESTTKNDVKQQEKPKFKF